MKRRDLLALGGGLVVAGLSPRLAWADELELLKAGQISAATEATYPPYSMRNAAGELDGIEIRTIKEVVKRMGLTYAPVETKWDSMLVGLLADEYDMCSETMAITDERKKKVWFCDGWCESGARLVVPNDSPIKVNADAKGKSVGALVASIFIPLAENLGAEVKTYQSDVEALQDCVNGKVDAVITDGVPGGYAIKTGGLPLRMTDEIMQPYQLGWPVKKGKKNLVMALNKALAEVVADGTFKSICMDLAGVDLTPKSPTRSDFS